MNLRLRESTTDDIEALADILGEAVAWMESRGKSLWRRDQVSAEALREDVSAGRYQLALLGERAIGSIKYLHDDPIFWPEAGPGEAAYLHRIVIRRAYAGGEISRDMLDLAGRLAVRQGKRFLRLDCAADRPRLRAVYERLGFAFQDERTVGEYRVARYQRALANS